MNPAVMFTVLSNASVSTDTDRVRRHAMILMINKITAIMITIFCSLKLTRVVCNSGYFWLKVFFYLLSGVNP